MKRWYSSHCCRHTVLFVLVTFAGHSWTQQSCDSSSSSAGSLLRLEGREMLRQRAVIQDSQWCFPELSQPLLDPSQEANSWKKGFSLPNLPVDSQNSSHCFENPHPISHGNRRAVNHHVQSHGFQLHPPALTRFPFESGKQRKCRNSYPRS